MRSGECVLPLESGIARHMFCKRENEEEVNREGGRKITLTSFEKTVEKTCYVNLH